MAQAVEVTDIQSLVFSGHAGLPHTVAVRLNVADAASARKGLRDLADIVEFGIPPKQRECSVQILICAQGLRMLESPADQVEALSRPFTQGMALPNRGRALGDQGPNDPTNWVWREDESHAWLLVYARDEAVAVRQAAGCMALLEPGWIEKGRMSTRLPPNSREPFGFLDGIGRIHIDTGDGGKASDGDILPPGEIVLGYPNALGLTPKIPPLGHNGSYVVLRQLAQNVKGFWEFWMKAGGGESKAVWLASKAVGRWPNGMPVDGGEPRPQPEFDRAAVQAPISFRDDPTGDRCPFGAHIRRANPRDGLKSDPERSLAISARHRILRRGRVYGDPVPSQWLPSVCRAPDELNRSRPENRESEEANGERGLFFVGLCGSIARQFEFVQQTWLNNPTFGGVYGEVDPIAAGCELLGDERRFSIPRDPLRLRVSGIQQWVTVRGGGYYLLPGRRALLSVIAAG